MWPFGRRQSTPQSPTDRLGRQGEKLARKHLRRSGLKILARNYRCPAGEADLIALDTSPGGAGPTIVFVEVKTRASDSYTVPESAVNETKRRHLRQIARYYLAGRNADEYSIRFDVVAIVLPEGSEPSIRHIVGAF